MSRTIRVPSAPTRYLFRAMFDIVIEKVGRLAIIEGDFPVDEDLLDRKRQTVERGSEFHVPGLTSVKSFLRMPLLYPPSTMVSQPGPRLDV